MKRLTCHGILIALIAILFQSAYSGFVDWFDWDLMLKENMIDPVWFRRFFGLKP